MIALSCRPVVHDALRRLGGLLELTRFEFALADLLQASDFLLLLFGQFAARVRRRRQSQ
jgi:hypothetical protein